MNFPLNIKQGAEKLRLSAFSAQLLRLALLFVPVSAKAVDFDLLIEAICQRETGNTEARGRAGELRPMQFLPTTWARFSRVPLAAAPAPELRRVAHHFLSIIQSKIVAQGQAETPYAYALRWNAGENAKWFSKRTRSYAQAVSNLYAEAEHLRSMRARYAASFFVFPHPKNANENAKEKEIGDTRARLMGNSSVSSEALDRTDRRSAWNSARRNEERPKPACSFFLLPQREEDEYAGRVYFPFFSAPTRP